jgi:hypothetical protein
MIIGDWGLGIGDWGLGIGDWAQSPIPNPQSPVPNPQSPIKYEHINKFKNIYLNFILHLIIKNTQINK